LSEKPHISRCVPRLTNHLTASDQTVGVVLGYRLNDQVALAQLWRSMPVRLASACLVCCLDRSGLMGLAASLCGDAC